MRRDSRAIILGDLARCIQTARHHPHRKRETPALFVAAMIGVEVLLRVDFDLTASPDTFLKQALDGLREKLARWHGYLPAHGRATGFIINYSPDHAIRFDLEGKAVEIFDRAYRLGRVQFAIGRRVISPVFTDES
jgi:hypothetical protein